MHTGEIEQWTLLIKQSAHREIETVNTTNKTVKVHTGEIEQWTLLIKQLKCTQERLNSEHY